jgi:hypothetical protein
VTGSLQALAGALHKCNLRVLDEEKVRLIVSLGPPLHPCNGPAIEIAAGMLLSCNGRSI